MIRRLSFAFFLVLALLLGQQLAVEHALAHAADNASHQKHLPSKADCDLCLEIAPLAGAVGTHVPAVHAVLPDLPRTIAVVGRVAALDAPVYFLSRAPPAALHA